MQKQFSVSDILSQAFGLLKQNAGFLIVTYVLITVGQQSVSSMWSSSWQPDTTTPLVQMLLGQISQAEYLEILQDSQTISPEIFMRPSFWIVFFLGIVAMMAFNVFTAAGYARFQLLAIDGETLEPKKFLTSFDTYLQYFLCQFYCCILVVLATMCCILPGIYVGTRLLFAPYYVIDRGMGAVEAIKACWNDMGGNWWHVFGGTILFSFIMLGGIFCCCIGLFFTVPLGGLAMVMLYRAVSKP